MASFYGRENVLFVRICFGAGLSSHFPIEFCCLSNTLSIISLARLNSTYLRYKESQGEHTMQTVIFCTQCPAAGQTDTQRQAAGTARGHTGHCTLRMTTSE